ncbi:MAG: hypothetical protein ACJ8HQ_03235 [Chthoniobacterales bacterium]
MKRRDGRDAAKDLLGAIGVGGLIVLFCSLLLRHDPNFFWTDDYQISILPVFTDVARSWSEGQLPLLSPYSWVCSNLAGEFQYGTFSVFVNAAVVVIWKFALSFPQQAAALSITHLVALGIGAYVLARGRDLSRPLSVFVALVASLNGWIICWGASDWFGALAAFTWLPWSWWALEKSARAEGSRTRVLWPAPFIYLLIAGGFPYTILMLGLVTAWLALQALLSWRDRLALVRLGLGWLLGLGLSAPAWIALVDYSAGSRRSVETFLPRQWLVPLKGLPGLILPAWTVQWHVFEEVLISHPAVELACGLAPIVLLLAVLLRRETRILSALRWDLGLLLVSLTLCMIPSAGILRFSFRWLALFHLVLALTAAEGWRIWTVGREQLSRWLSPSPGAWAVFLVALSWVGMATFGLTTKGTNLILPLVSFSAAIVWWLGDMVLNRRAAAWLPALVAFPTLLATYLSLDVHATTARYWFSDDLKSSAPLDPDRLYLSIYPAPQEYYRGSITGMPYGATTRPGSTSMFGRVHLINGYSPVGPAGVNRLFDFGTHGHINPAKLNEAVIGEAGSGGLLENLGIDGIIVAYQSFLPGTLPNDWQLAFHDNEAEVYHRTTPLPPVRALADEQFGAASIEVIQNARHRVLADVTRNGDERPIRVAFSRPYFSGYRAKFDGHELSVGSFQGLMPIVDIPAGERGQLELTYRPRAVTVGVPVALLTLLLIGLAIPIIRVASEIPITKTAR